MVCRACLQWRLFLKYVVSRVTVCCIHCLLQYWLCHVSGDSCIRPHRAPAGVSLTTNVPCRGSCPALKSPIGIEDFFRGGFYEIDHCTAFGPCSARGRTPYSLFPEDYGDFEGRAGQQLCMGDWWPRTHQQQGLCGMLLLQG